MKQKRILTLLTAAGILLANVPLIPVTVLTASAEETPTSGTCGENLTWTFDLKTGTLTISGKGAMTDFVNNAPWDEIRYEIRTVKLPDGLTSIGNRAFYRCQRLESVIIPNSVTSIGLGAFAECIFLDTVMIPESVTSIDHNAFSQTQWLEAKRSENPLVIVNHMLLDGEKVKGDVVIPDEVTSINSSAFYNAYDLTSITIPKTVTSIEAFTFYNCISLAAVAIPDSVTSIGESAFEDCSGLTEIIIPNSVTSIGEFAFSGCSDLTSITIPESVTSFGAYAFDGTPWLENKQAENPLVVVGSNLIDGSTCSGKVEIPNSVTTICDDAFYGCSDLTEIIIPNSVTSIGDYAFSDCHDLYVTLPESVLEIDETVFQGTNPVIKGHTGSKAELIAKKHGFKFESIDKMQETTTTTTTTMATTTTTTVEGVGSLGKDVSYKIDGDTVIISGTGTITTSVPSKYGNTIKHVIINEGITKIDSYYTLFSKYTKLEDVKFPQSLISIKGRPFWGCSTVKEFDIPDTVTEIEDGAFIYCAGALCSAKGSTAEQFAKDHQMFFKDKATGRIEPITGKLTDTITFSYTPDKVLTLNGTGDIPGCSSEESPVFDWAFPVKVIIGEGITKIGTQAFNHGSYITDYLCDAGISCVKEVVLPDSLQVIAPGAFWEGKDYVWDDTETNLNWKDVIKDGFHYRYQFDDILISCYRDSSNSDENGYDTQHNDLVIPEDVKFIAVSESGFSALNPYTSTTVPESVRGIYALPDSLIRGVSGSTAHKYATEHYLLFEDINTGKITPVKGKCGENVSFVLDADRTLTISGTGPMEDYISYSHVQDGDNEYHWGYPKDSPFSRVVKKVIIEPGVTTIGAFSFRYLPDLETISIPDTVTRLGESCIMYCPKLNHLVIPDSVTEILECGSMPETFSPFEGCSSLDDITFPKHLTNIGCFSPSMPYWEKHPEEHPDNVYYVSDYLMAYYYWRDGENNLTELNVRNGTTHIGEFVFNNPMGEIKLQSVTFPNGLTHLGKAAFQQCGSLKKADLPDSVEWIDYWAFYGTALENVTIPAKTVFVGRNAYCLTKDLKTITFLNPNTEIYDSPFTICNSYDTDENEEEHAIFTGVIRGYKGSTAQTYAEKYGYKFESLGEPPVALTTTSATITTTATTTTSTTSKSTTTSTTTKPTSTTTASTTPKPTTTNSTSTTPKPTTTSTTPKPTTTTTISTTPKPTTTTTISTTPKPTTTTTTSTTPKPTTTTTISTTPKPTTTATTSTTSKPTTTTISTTSHSATTTTVSTVLNQTTNITTDTTSAPPREYIWDEQHAVEYEVFDNYAKVYACDANYKGNIQISSEINGKSVVEIKDEAFMDCTGITGITIPDSVINIGTMAFRGCTGLTDITIPGNIKSIGSHAFHDCTDLSSVTLLEGVGSIEVAAFGKCDSLKEITIPGSVKTVGNYAFSDCPNLTSVIFEDGVTTIGTNVFWNCSSLTQVKFPQSLTDLGASAFFGTPLLESAQAENACLIVDHILVDGKTVKGRLTVPDTVTLIGDHAFQMCKEMTEVILPDGLIKVDDYAFNSCNGLTSVTLPNGVKGIGEYAFAYCKNLESVVIPESVSEIDPKAFLNCDKLMILGYAGSAAETFANANNIPFQPLPTPETMTGDINGDSTVSVEDAQLALVAYVQSMAGLDHGLTEVQVKAADINGDNTVSVEDAQLILLYYVQNTISGIPTTWDELIGNKK